MSQKIDLPQRPRPTALLDYVFTATPLRAVMHAARAVGIAAALLLLAMLFGRFTGQWIELEEPETAMPFVEWPEVSDAVKPMIMSDDGSAHTLSLQDVRNRLISVNANARRAAEGQELIDVTDKPVAELAASTDPALAAYADWVDGSACSLSGWKGESRKSAAALVRNGVWGCGGVKRAAAGMPLVIELGFWLGGFLSLVLAFLILGYIGYVIRGTWHAIQEHRAHDALYGSWAGKRGSL